MKVFLGGGGSGEKTKIVNQIFANSLDKSKPLMYLPTAMNEERYPKCLEWINGELNTFGVNKIEMISNIYDFVDYDLNRYSGIFIGGGNTYKLLKLLKESNGDKKIKEYLKNDGIIFGGSAGSIIFGKDIEHCEYMDTNDVNLIDTKGFNILNGVSITAHYTNGSNEENKIAHDYIVDYCIKNKTTMLAVPEETAVLVENYKATVIGAKECYAIKKDGKEYKIVPDNSLIKNDINYIKESIER